jgi:biotin carboxyl carrier protein
VTAPNLGAFCRAPAPGAAPYVAVGQVVAPQDQVGLLEVMKLYTPVRAGVAGVVREICIADGELVEFGQRLLLVAPGSA